MKYIKGDYTIEDYTIYPELTETFDNGSIECFSFTINDGDYEISFVGSSFELDGEVSAYLNLGDMEGEVYDAQTGNSKTLWNAAAELCYEVGFEDGEYSFCIDEPGDSEMGQKIHEMMGEYMSGYGYVKVVDGEPAVARWTETEDGEGVDYAPEMTEAEEE